MRRLRSLSAWLMLALWLPATLHCDLEAAGIRGVVGCHEHETATLPHGEEIGCHSIDGLSYHPGSGVLKAPGPVVAVLCVVFAPVAAAPALAPVQSVPPTGTSPPEIARAWQFAVRAAPWPGAPALVA